MKKRIPILIIAAVSAIIFAACNGKPQTDTGNSKVLTPVDTAGLADFQKWKVLNERTDPAMYSQQDNEKRTYAQAHKSSTNNRSTGSKSVSMSSTDRYPA